MQKVSSAENKKNLIVITLQDFFLDKDTAFWNLDGGGGLCGVWCNIIKHCSKLRPFVSCRWCVYASFD